MAPTELTHDPLALLDAPRPPFEEEWRAAQATKLEESVNEFTLAMDDCANAAAEAEEEMGNLLRVTACHDCRKLYLADSERLQKVSLLSTSGLAGPMELPITLCDECMSGVKRRSKKTGYTDGTALNLSDLYGSIDGMKLTFNPFVLSGSTTYTPPNTWGVANTVIA